MKRFLLVFEDLLQAHVQHEGINEPQSCTVRGNSKDEVVNQLGLILRKKDPRRVYWDGKNGNVLIFLHEVSDKEISSREEMVELAQRLYCEWS